MNDRGTELFEAIKQKRGLREKSPFSPFPNGGLEIKATCGSVPTPMECAKKGIEKPDMGETRIHLLRGYDWKAHHRETNNLVGILWDFINGTPKIVAVFFGTDLDEQDWGKIVHPREGGGRTTSVSIMPRHGVKKMYCNWIAVKQDPAYINFLNNYNKGNLIPL
ncbi:bsaAI [Corticimicrobacter populi]|uniref:BsaAI n=2 Tax=Corticimicrobacter populi TaxID=2175229 RepID=A0A2V1JV73_9BURK|nr:bsaAI [Corticimicrobacter populi]